MGHDNDPKTAGLFAPMHHGVPADIKVARDLAFGGDAAQKVDIFTSGQGSGKPILIYVHGGGFTRGDKHPPGSFMYDNVMVWAVQHVAWSQRRRIIASRLPFEISGRQR